MVKDAYLSFSPTLPAPTHLQDEEFGGKKERKNFLTELYICKVEVALLVRGNKASRQGRAGDCHRS
jgi:hypothetical protein